MKIQVFYKILGNFADFHYICKTKKENMSLSEEFKRKDLMKPIVLTIGQYGAFSTNETMQLEFEVCNIDQDERIVKLIFRNIV